MKKSFYLLASAAALLAGASLQSPAEAGQRLRSLQVFFPPLYFIDPHPEDFYDGPQDYHDAPPLRPRRHVKRYDYGYDVPPPRPRRYDYSYGEPPYGDPGYDQGYYEPEPLPTPRLVKTPVKKTATVPAKKTVTSSKTTVPATVKKPATKPVTTASATPKDTGGAAGRLTCDKASGIVSGYGFASVKAQTCSGASYRFLATRGGKTYAVTVASASGELTEVKKLP